jgi:hypothetical protein
MDDSLMILNMLNETNELLLGIFINGEISIELSDKAIDRRNKNRAIVKSLFENSGYRLSQLE